MWRGKGRGGQRGEARQPRLMRALLPPPPLPPLLPVPPSLRWPPRRCRTGAPCTAAACILHPHCAVVCAASTHFRRTLPLRVRCILLPGVPSRPLRPCLWRGPLPVDDPRRMAEGVRSVTDECTGSWRRIRWQRRWRAAGSPAMRRSRSPRLPRLRHLHPPHSSCRPPVAQVRLLLALLLVACASRCRTAAAPPLARHRSLCPA
jgi:hypothetical protein